MSIFVRILGGLGNQMFQYAAGRSLSCKLNMPLKLDVSAFEDYPDREYRLHQFPIQATLATPGELDQLHREKHIAPATLAAKMRRKMMPWYWQKIIREKSFAFDSGFNRIRQSCYLDGYWQSEFYFLSVISILKKDFRFPSFEETYTDDILQKIKDTGANAVSVHIRRGDYIRNPDVRKVHGVLGPSYYQKAVARVESVVKNPVFFIFSDEPSLARDLFDTPHECTFIGFQKDKIMTRTDSDIKDLFLMSRCNHHIIANSSFSWWGAWLGESEDSLTIAPEHWFSKEAQKVKSVKDLIPKRWVSL